jgi:hypothetical protein
MIMNPGATIVFSMIRKTIIMPHLTLLTLYVFAAITGSLPCSRAHVQVRNCGCAALRAADSVEALTKKYFLVYPLKRQDIVAWQDHVAVEAMLENYLVSKYGVTSCVVTLDTGTITVGANFVYSKENVAHASRDFTSELTKLFDFPVTPRLNFYSGSAATAVFANIQLKSQFLNGDGTINLVAAWSATLASLKDMGNLEANPDKTRMYHLETFSVAMPDRNDGIVRKWDEVIDLSLVALDPRSPNKSLRIDATTRIWRRQASSNEWSLQSVSRNAIGDGGKFPMAGRSLPPLDALQNSLKR